MEIEDQIRTFLVENLWRGKVPERLSDDDPLAGLLDSLSVLELAAFLEKTWGVHVEDEELVLDNFNSVNDIGRFIKRKRPDLQAGN